MSPWAARELGGSVFSKVRRHGALLMSTVAVFSLGLSAIGTTSASAQSGSTQGVTSNTVTLGLLGDISGALGSSFGGAEQGAKAAIAAQNAKGGVDGRKIVLDIGDTQSNPNDVVSVTQSLIQQKHVFAIMEATAFFSEVYQVLVQSGTPGVTDLPFDSGPEWGSTSITDLVDGGGGFVAAKPAPAPWFTNILKAGHCTKLASVGYGGTGDSVATANQIKSGAEQAGIKVVDEDNSVSETSVDLTPNAITVKNSGANCWVILTAATQLEALATALNQEGSSAKGVFHVNGYLPDLLTGSLNKIDQGDITAFPWVTPEINKSVGEQITEAMKKYEGYTGPVDVGWELPQGAYEGYTAAILAINGLKAAGKNLTTSSFLNGLHEMKAFTADGLQAPVNLAVSKQGTYPGTVPAGCAYAEIIKGTKFVPVSTKEYC